LQYFGSLVGFILIVTAFRHIKGKLSNKDMYCEIEISFLGYTTNVTAIIDTGNMLKEPITGVSVIVVEKEKLQNILPEYILDHLEDVMEGGLEYDKYLSKFRVIPFSSLGKENGMLLGFKPDSVKIYFDTEEKDVNAIVGIYEKKLSKTGAYNGLVGLDVLESEGEVNEYITDIKV